MLLYRRYSVTKCVQMVVFLAAFSWHARNIESFSISSLFIHTLKKHTQPVKVGPAIRQFLPVQTEQFQTNSYDRPFSECFARDMGVNTRQRMGNEVNFSPSSPSSSHGNLYVHSNLRVLQFNILADGLAGLRKDLGGFSRVKRDDIVWENRRGQILEEITQYDPDVITLQECDHYYDYFLPKLSGIGYDGLFSPKPSSACLEVSSNPDGCCIFVKRKKLRIRSAETLSYSLSKAEVAEDSNLSDEDYIVRIQNQVALIAICELVTSVNKDIVKPPPILIATTHLKALKTSLGERYRLSEARQLLDAMSRVLDSYEQRGKPCAVILTGDLNASPTNITTGYPPLAYSLVKGHRLNFRSVLNDDIPANYCGVLGKIHQKQQQSIKVESNEDKTSSKKQKIEPGVWTTWKARLKKGQEKVARHCIDYILYSPLIKSKLNGTCRQSNVGIRAASVLDLYDDKDMSATFLPSASYPSDHLAIAADLQIVEEF